MSGKARYIAAALAMTAVLSAGPTWADVAGRPHDLSLDNPQGHCLNCHDLHQTALGEGYAHNLKRSNEIEVCYQCHAGALNNYSSIDPSLPNRTTLYSDYDILTEFNQAHIHFPQYGMDGEHNKCSDCHNPHGVFDHTSTTRKPKLVSAGPDVVTDTDEYCFVCHNSDAEPPHPPFPNISVGAKYRISRDIYRGMTHSTFFRATTVTEPVPDTARTYDDNPYGGGKDISCLTCHRPHGSPHEHMLKSVDNQDFCLACHNGTKAASLTQYTTAGHGKTGVRRICQECHFPHGTGQENAVSKTIKDPHTGTDNTVNLASGMNEACFACHGSASTNKYYPGKTTYNAGIHKTSANSHNPADAAGDQAAGDCDNCHNPHGTVAKYGKMLVAQQDESMCYACHNETTPNTASGEDVKAAFQNMSSRHDMTKVKCTNCHNVHRATQGSVMMNPFKPQSTIGDKKTFCLKCHSGTMPAGVTGAPNVNAEWANGGHDSSHKLACQDCHESHGSPNRNNLNYEFRTYSSKTADFARGMGFASRAFCEACHGRASSGYKGAKVIPTGSGYVGQHDQSDTTPCSSCHLKRHNPRLSSYTGGTAYYTTACLNCHTQDAGNPYPSPDAEFNTPTNASDINTRKSVHDITYSPPGAVDCTKCHGAKHETNHSQTSKVFDPDTSHGVSGPFNIAGSSAFCIECHDSTPVKTAGKTPPNILETYTSVGHGSAFAGRTVCSTCHVHHGSVNEKLIKTEINGSVVMGAYSGNNVSVCTACHRGTGAKTPQWSGYSVYSGSIHAFGNRTTGNAATDGRHGAGACVNCHNPHGAKADGRNTHSMLYKSEEELCYTCHNSQTHNTANGDDVQAQFSLASHHNVTDADQLGQDGIKGTADDSKIECEDCHDPHTITERLMAFTNMSDTAGKRVVPVEADQDFCIKCHSSTPPAGVKYPAVGVWDKSEYVSSAHGNHLKRDRGFANYSNGVTYPCKVCHHPHGSSQAAQQRESWDIDRDGIPDDIDGDGLLDSADMVGFIGYTAGTRRAILVNSTTGIPSRYGFKRVSSTIPYQSNGTIDVEVCFNCHDGTPAPDVEVFFYKRSHHDVTYADQVAGGGSKIECYTCHDQHRAQARDDSAGEYATTNPYAPREPMPGDASFCLRCHDNTLPDGVSFGDKHLKNIKLSYNPYDRRDASGYDLLTSYMGHYVQSGGEPMMCRDCHNQHGSDYTKMLRDNTESGKPNYDPSQPMQEILAVALRQTDPMGGGDDQPASSTSEHCLACHSGVTRYKTALIPLPPPPDAAARGFTMSPVGKHPDLNAEVTSADETGGHIYKTTFALITTPGSVKEDCTACHDSHNPYISTVDGQLMDCYQCHNENTTLPDTQSEFNDNPTNPARSKSIHPVKYDPSGTTPAYVECLKCHDQSRHMQGMVRLRKDPSRFDNYTSEADVWVDPVDNRTVNQFCMECHGPDTTVASSFWRGGAEHTPPRLPSGHADGAHFVNGSLLCTDCHEYHGSRSTGMRRDDWGDQEALCLNCHRDPAKSMSGMNVMSKFTSTNGRHNVDDAEQESAGSRVECEDCHNPHTVTRTSPVVDADDKVTPVAPDDGFCVGCHDADGAGGVKFPGYTSGTSKPEWDSATGRWNRWDKSAYLGSVHQNGGLACKECHDPHGSPSYALLLANVSTSTGVKVGFGMHSTSRGKRQEEIGVNRFCAACHKGANGAYDGYATYTSLSFGSRGFISQTSLSAVRKKGVDKNCTYCHNPHGTGQASLIRSNKPLYMNMTSNLFGSMYYFRGFNNSTTGKPYYAFCSSRSCHEGVSKRDQRYTYAPYLKPETDTFNMDLPADNFTGDETKSSHHPIKEGTMACTTCHKEHGSSYPPDLRAPYFRENRWPRLFKSGRGAYDTYRYPGYNDAYYGTQFDGSNYFEKARYNQPDQTRRNLVINVTPPDNANDLCFMCHQKDDIIGTTFSGMTGTNTKFLGHEAVKGGARCSKNISNYGSGLGTDYHKFSCSMCHFPHSTGKGKLLKVGCFRPADNSSPTLGYATVFYCHAYTKFGNFNGGWRNLTTASKRDFKRPPNQVTDLSAASDPDLTVRLSWTAVADGPGQKADHYNVYRSSQQITQVTKPYATRIYKGAVNSGVDIGYQMNWSDLTGQPNTTYHYAVVACDSENNESFVSNSVSAALGADTYVPAAISDQQTAQVDGTYNVKLTWHDPGDNVNVTQYKVYRKDGSSPLTDPDITPGNFLNHPTISDTSQSSDGSGYPADASLYTYTDTTAQFGQTYSYAVVALDSAGLVSPVPTGSTFTVAITDPPPATVSTLTVKPVSAEMKALLMWSAPTNVGSISGYNVYRKAGTALTQAELTEGNRIAAAVPGITYTDDNVPLTGTSYYYAVTAVDESSGQESKLGNTVSVNIPAAPGGLAVTKLLNNCLQLSWSAPSVTTNLSHYRIYTRKDSGAWSRAVIADNSANLVTGGTFESGLGTSWSAYSLTAEKDDGLYYEGAASIKLTATGNQYDQFIETVNYISVQPSTTYTYSGYVYIPAALGGGGQAALRVIEYNSSNVYVGEHTAPGLNLAPGWQRLNDTWTTNASTYKVKLRLQTPYTGTVYWDDVRLVADTTTATSAKIDLPAYEPGTYDITVTAYYSSYGGTTPYESPKPLSGYQSVSLSDSYAAENFSPTCLLTLASNYTLASLSWNAPYDRNFAGYGVSGLGYYRIQATYDLGKTWNTLIRSKLTNPGYETFTGTADDTGADTMTDWTSYGTYVYAVKDSLYDSYAVKIKYISGYSDRYIVAAEPSTGQSVANQTYSMSFWAKSNKSTTFQYFVQANGGNYESVGTASPAIGTEWQRFTTFGTFSPSATATSARVVIRPSTDTTAEITIDGVRLDSGMTAMSANDGTYYQPSGYDTPGSPQGYDDPKIIAAGTSARYRVQAVDQQGNFSGQACTNTAYAKPAAVSDLTVGSSTTTSANVLKFTSPVSLAGLDKYRVYAKEQSTPLTSTAGATLLTPTPITPAIASGGNFALRATSSASANYTYSSYVANNARDGSYSTYWWGTGGHTNTITIDLGSELPVGKVYLVFESTIYYRPRDYQVQTSTDNVNWTTQASATDNTNQYPSPYTFNTVNARYVRLNITDVGYMDGHIAYYGPKVCEFEVYPYQNELYVHDLQNTEMQAEPGHTYAYAVVSEDMNGLLSEISSGPSTVWQVQDKDAPEKVTDLEVTSPVGTTQVILNWRKPLDNSGYGAGTGAVRYEVYRLPTSSVGTPAAVTDDNYTTASLVDTRDYPPGPSGTFTNYTATWYDHKGVHYAVRSGDNSGNWSKISNSPFIVVGKDTQAPTPPVITDCVPVESPEVDVYWTPATDNVELNGYRLFRANVDVEPFLSDQCITENNIDQAEVAVNLIPYNAVSVADTGGTPGTSYYFALRAWDSENNLSNISNCAVATVRTTDTDSTPPTWGGTPLTVTQGAYPDIDLVWTPASDLDDSGGPGTIDHYSIYRSLSSFSAVNEPGVSLLATLSGVRSYYVDVTGAPETTYYYGLVAVDASAAHNQSAVSNIASATVMPSPSPDNTPPSAPADLGGSTGVYPYMNLSWTASTDVDDASDPQPLNYYKLYRSDYPLDITDANKDNQAEVETFIMANDAVSYAARGIGDALYNFRIEAIDLAGNASGLSNQVTVQVATAPCVDTTPPGAPSNLAGVIGPSPDVALSWTASIDNGGGCAGVIDHYVLYRANYEITADTDLRTLTPTFIAGNSVTYTDSSGAPNTQYWYVLTAVDSTGNESGKSNIITRTTAADTMAPAAVADLKANPSTGKIQLTWCRPSDNVGISRYDIYRKEQGAILVDADIVEANRLASFVNAGACLSYDDDGVTSGHTYSYAVIAVDGAGNRSTISRGRNTGDTVASAP